MIDKLQNISDQGFDAAEIFENDLLSAPQSATEIGKIMRDLGLDCAMFQPFRDYEGLPRELSDRAIDRIGASSM